MRVARLTVSRAAFGDTMGAIRSWLDANGGPLVRFETASDGDAIEIKLEFPDEAFADAFRREFSPSTDR